MNNNENEFHKLLDIQIKKCADDSYLLGRLRSFLDTLLPSHLNKAADSRELRAKRRSQLEKEEARFTQEFLLKHRYAFSSPTELFFKYDGVNLSIYSEDDVLHDILTLISENRSLTQWKHKIKVSILKRIKERHPFSLIPESSTIQTVIEQLRAQYFSSKNSTKYFMTVIGDCLRGKVDSRIYIAHPSLKTLVQEIMHYSFSLFGVSSTSFQSIKFKYHSAHTFDLVRLIRSSRLDRAVPANTELRRTMINVLYVCAHYSERYGGSDEFLSQHETHGDGLAEYTFFLRDHSLNNIVQEFADAELQLSSRHDSRISSKDMKFLWKRYLENNQLPHIASYEVWHSVLKTIRTHDQESDTFVGITSPHLPLVSSFCKFWDDYIVKDEESELDAGDIVMLFTSVGGRLGRGTTDPTAVLIDLVRHFYPTVMIEDDKYALGVKCILWDKADDVAKAVEGFKTYQTEKGYEYSTSLDAIYEYYSKVPKTKAVSKRLFEKMATDILGDYIDAEGCISATWWE
jgi:hypothetical protein